MSEVNLLSSRWMDASCTSVSSSCIFDVAAATAAATGTVGCLMAVAVAGLTAAATGG